MSTAIDPLDEFKEAYAILDGVPEERLDLRSISVSWRERCEFSCRTIACGVGWLLHHPRYQARGFGYASDGLMKADGRTFDDDCYGKVAGWMLGIPPMDAELLFAPLSIADRSTREPDKQILLSRMRRYIESHAATAKGTA